MKRFGGYLIAASVVAFVLSFFMVVTGHAPSACGGGDCFEGGSRWLILLTVSIIGFVAGCLLVSFGGQGFGRSDGPKDFAAVDSGDWSPARRAATTEAVPPVRRWSRSWRNIYLYTGVGELGLAAMFFIAGASTPEARGGLFLTGAILGIVGIVLSMVGLRAAAKDRLHETGIAGEATILGITQTGAWVNNNPYVKLDLQITVPGHPAY